MGSLRGLARSSVNLLYTSSSRMEMLIYDTLKKKSNVVLDNVFIIESKSDFNNMLDLVNTQPFNSDKWLFVIEYSRVKGVIKSKIGLFESETSEFLVKVANYRDYKEFKGMFKYPINDMYFSSIRLPDISYLLADYTISEDMIIHVSKAYGSDPEKIFMLIDELETGSQIVNKKQITEICGVSLKSLQSYSFTLLKDLPKTEQYRKRNLSSAVSTGVLIANEYGYSKMRNFLLSSIKDILDIKMLYLNGAIYDKIIDVPECYGDKLDRYNYYLRSIIEIPYNRIVCLYLMLKDAPVWRTDTDMIRFLYDFYSREVVY